jgi:hypothetical protein
MADRFSEDDAVIRAFVTRRPDGGGGLVSRSLGGQLGAWVLSLDGFVGPDEQPMPFAAILDCLPSVVLVVSGVNAITGLKEVRDAVWHFAVDAGLRVEMNNHALMELGESARVGTVGGWYAELERRNSQQFPRLLIVGEAAPDPRGPDHHFYADPITSGDHLFRAVAGAVRPEQKLELGRSKEEILESLDRHGLFVRYAIQEPVPFNSDRYRRLAEGAGDLLDSIQSQSPHHLIVCGPSVLERLHHFGMPWSLPLMHTTPIPEQPRGWQARRRLRELILKALEIAPVSPVETIDGGY